MLLGFVLSDYDDNLYSYPQAGQNGLLEVARQTYKEASQDAVNHMNDLAGTLIPAVL